MAAKTNGKGSIYQLDKGKDGKKPKSKCRKWRLVVSLGKDPRTGKYRQKAKNFNGTYTDAQRELRAFVAQIEGGTLVKRSGWTFNAYAKHYVDTRVAAGEIQERTANSLRGTLKALGHRIGEMALQKITPECRQTARISNQAIYLHRCTWDSVTIPNVLGGEPLPHAFAIPKPHQSRYLVRGDAFVRYRSIPAFLCPREPFPHPRPQNSTIRSIKHLFGSCRIRAWTSARDISTARCTCAST